MFKKIFSATCLALGMATACHTPAEQAAAALAGRIAPAYAPRIVFVETDAPADTYRLEVRDGKLIIEASDALSMAVGLNRYLKDCCGVDISWDLSEPVVLPAEMPLPEAPLEASALVRKRFFLNYCTFGYTMPWWGWDEWERLIDWMAMNGVNLPLATSGQEAVWQEVWRMHGLTDDEIRSWFTGPAHLPWHRMCNIDGVDGPLPQAWIDAQAKLQQQILSRERALGMRPVLPAFAGHVPGAFKELYPEADITDITGWSGFRAENLPHFLSPADPLYARIQQEFLEAQTRLYGTDHIYGFDLFNEVDPPSWDSGTLAAIARDAFGSVAAEDPLAEWLQMGWMFYYDRTHWTPEIMEAYLTAVPQGKVILLDYYTENVPVWESTQSFYGQPFIFCYLGNFGGNTRIAGPFRKESRRLTEALEQEGMAGIGCTLEGFGINRWFYEYMLDRAWDNFPGDDAWLRGLDRRRHSPEGFWTEAADSLYLRGSFSEGPLLCGRPCLEGYRHWTVIHETPYENVTLVRAWKALLDYPAPSVPAWREDVVALGCQALGNHFATLRDRFTAAYRANDAASAKAISQEMRQLLADLSALSACSPQFRLDRWLSAAASWATSPEEEAYFRHNAWHLLTTWGDAPNLNDYANRLWSGLVTYYYAPRWQLFLDEVLDCLSAGQPFDQAAFDTRCYALEQRIAAEAPIVSDVPPTPDMPALARTLISRYFPDYE